MDFFGFTVFSEKTWSLKLKRTKGPMFPSRFQTNLQLRNDIESRIINSYLASEMYKYIFGQIFHTVPCRSKLNKPYVRTYVRNIFLFAFVRIIMRGLL